MQLILVVPVMAEVPEALEALEALAAEAKLAMAATSVLIQTMKLMIIPAIKMPKAAE